MDKNEKGFSFVEILLVIAIIGSIVVLLSNIPSSLSLIGKSRHLSLGREIASKQIEDKRALNYINLTPGSQILKDLDSRVALLPSGDGTVVVEDCDPQANPDFCPNDEQIKIITVTVKWQENNKQQEVKLSTFMGEGGLNQ